MQRPELEEHHKLDDKGVPTGGSISGVGIQIDWQNGPLLRDGVTTDPNGARVEGVIMAAISRLRFYQGSAFACSQNDQAITTLEQALNHLDQRSAERQTRGVKGTHQV